MSIATINWTNVPGSVSTLVQYKLPTDTTWTTPAYPPNPTPLSTYFINILDGTYYNVKLTTNGVACGPMSTTFTIINGPLTTTTTSTSSSTTSTSSTAGPSTSTTTTTTTTAPFGLFKASALYGMTITNIYVAGVESGAIPLLTYPITPGNTSSATFTSSLYPNIISVTLSGTPSTTIKLDLYINSVVVYCIAIPSAGTYDISFPGATVPSVVFIAVDSGTC